MIEVTGDSDYFSWERGGIGTWQIGEDRLLLVPAELERLKARWGEYSCSYPTGIYEGKKWFRNARAYGNPPGEEWFCAEIERDADPSSNELMIRWRRVVWDEKRLAADAARRLSGEDA
jgi:hypothetical protein